MTPPASTEPMYLISESEHKKIGQKLERMAQAFETVYNHLQEFDTDSYIQTVTKFERAHLNIDDILVDTRARGPVQQAPAAKNEYTILSWRDQEFVKAEIDRFYNENTTIDGTHTSRHAPFKVVINPLSTVEHDAALIAQEREKWEREQAQLTASALNKQDLLSRLISIDQNAPDIRTVEQELQRTIAEIRSGAFDECNPEQCRHVIKMMKAGVSVCEKEAAQAREDALDEIDDEMNIRVVKANAEQLRMKDYPGMSSGAQHDKLAYASVRDYIRSLRSPGQKQEREPE